MNQAALNFEPLEGERKTLDESLYRAFERRALEIAMRGHNHCSARYIIESFRYETNISGGDRQFKINNNQAPAMARRWMCRYGSRFPKFFRCRDLLGRDS